MGDSATFELKGDNSDLSDTLQDSSSLFEAFGAGVSSAFSKISDAVSSMVSSIGSTFASLATPITALASKASEMFSALKTKIVDSFKQAFSAVADLVPLYFADIGTGIRTGFASLADDEKALFRVKSILKATGEVAGFTEKQLQEMADVGSEGTAFGGDEILNAQAELLQFRNIRGTVFTETLKLSADLAAATGGDLASAAAKLGSSLNDPIRGMKKLREEVGIFSETEVRLIEQMTMSGNVVGAQTALMERLSSVVGGAAAAENETFYGKLRLVNQALDDQWKAISSALIPAIEAVLPWIQQGAESTTEWADAFAEWVKVIVDWANESWPIIKRWAEQVTEQLVKAAEFIVDKMTEAFTYVQTAIQDLPGYAEMMKAKFMVVWEQLKQLSIGVWEHITVYVENAWNSMLDSLKKGFDKFSNSMAHIIVEIPGIAKLLGVSKEELHETLSEMGKEIDKFPTTPKKVVQGPTDEDKKRLDDLKSAAAEASSGFDEKFSANLEENKKFAERIKDTFRGITGEGFKADEIEKDIKAKLSKEGYKISKEDKAESAGQFEDLVSLQKRIQSSAYKTPETKALDQQTMIMQNQHKEFLKKQDELKKENEKQREATEKVEKAIRETNTGPKFSD